MAKSSFDLDVSGFDNIEEWRPALDFEYLYEVSNWGRVRRHGTKKLLTMRTLAGNGYVIVMMSKNGKYQNQLVHRLVLKAFCGAPVTGQQCRHLNGVRTDNRLENLRWGSAKENAADQIAHGMHRNARKTHCKRGHEFNEENTYIRPSGKRLCRVCKREYQNEQYRLGVPYRRAA
jgi:hypothetical protein